jgi:hypothetical protein
MSKKIFLIFLTIALCIQLKAQFKAKMTDRFLIKTDLAMMALQNGYNASIEIRFAKNKTIEVGYFDGSEKFNQNQNFTQNIYNSSTEGIPKSIVNSQYTYVTLKFYQGRVIKAPIGFYFSINASYGACDFSGLAYYDDLPTFLRNPDFTNTINPYVIHNIEMIKGGVGFGLAPIFTGGCDVKGEPESNLGECFENRVGEPDELMGRGEGERLKDAMMCDVYVIKILLLLLPTLARGLHPSV